MGSGWPGKGLNITQSAAAAATDNEKYFSIRSTIRNNTHNNNNDNTAGANWRAAAPQSIQSAPQPDLSRVDSNLNGEFHGIQRNMEFVVWRELVALLRILPFVPNSLHLHMDLIFSFY